MTDLVRVVFRRAVVVAVIFLCLTTTASIFANYSIHGKFSNDFGVYWRSANMPVETIYLWKGRFPFPYAPTMLLWISPLTLIPKWPAYFLFVGSSLAAFYFALRPHVPKAAIALAVISPAFARGIFTGQVCALLSAMMVWACASTNRVMAGTAFGIVATVKPQLVVMAPLMFVINRDWRAMAAAGAAFVSAVVLSILIFGPARWPEWLASMDHFRHAVVDYGVIKIGVTPASVAERHGLPPLPFLLLGTTFGAGITYLCRDGEPLEKAAAIGIGSLLASPYALAYDLTIIMPLLAARALQGKILPAWGMVSSFHPLPLAIAAFELVRKLLWKLEAPWSMRRIRTSMSPETQ